MNPPDHFERGEIESSIREIDKILSTQILAQPKYGAHPLKYAAFISVMIHLRDLMQKAENYGSRIDFKDDVIQTPWRKNKQVEDATDLITFIRDAVCHLDIENRHLHPNIKFSFNVIYGKMTRPLINYGGVDIGPTSDYEDDVAYCFGPQKIYLVRHIYRAFKEAQDVLGPLLNPPLQKPEN